jgi:hypothetical protein
VQRLAALRCGEDDIQVTELDASRIRAATRQIHKSGERAAALLRGRRSFAYAPRSHIRKLKTNRAVSGHFPGAASSLI